MVADPAGRASADRGVPASRMAPNVGRGLPMGSAMTSATAAIAARCPSPSTDGTVNAPGELTARPPALAVPRTSTTTLGALLTDALVPATDHGRLFERLDPVPALDGMDLLSFALPETASRDEATADEIAGDPNLQCLICYAPAEAPEPARLYARGCGHWHHRGCARRWLATQRRDPLRRHRGQHFGDCPLCRHIWCRFDPADLVRGDFVDPAPTFDQQYGGLAGGRLGPPDDDDMHTTMARLQAIASPAVSAAGTPVASVASSPSLIFVATSPALDSRAPELALDPLDLDTGEADLHAVEEDLPAGTETDALLPGAAPPLPGMVACPPGLDSAMPALPSEPPERSELELDHGDSTSPPPRPLPEDSEADASVLIGPPPLPPPATAPPVLPGAAEPPPAPAFVPSVREPATLPALDPTRSASSLPVPTGPAASLPAAGGTTAPAATAAVPGGSITPPMASWPQRTPPPPQRHYIGTPLGSPLPETAAALGPGSSSFVPPLPTAGLAHQLETDGSPLEPARPSGLCAPLRAPATPPATPPATAAAGAGLSAPSLPPPSLPQAAAPGLETAMPPPATARSPTLASQPAAPTAAEVPGAVPPGLLLDVPPTSHADRIPCTLRLHVPDLGPRDPGLPTT